VFNATSADLREFESHHGKLIMFMGLQDPVGAADEATNYYQAVEATASGGSEAARRKQTQAFLRLYMVPGMAHCAGGPGATHFSTATRDSEPPVSDRHIAFQRPLCVYPLAARYTGGPTNSADSFACAPYTQAAGEKR
jgi:feruloyl esterase